MYKVIIGPGVFSYLQNLIFWVVNKVKRQKMGQNGKELSVALNISGRIHHIIVFYTENRLGE